MAPTLISLMLAAPPPQARCAIPLVNVLPRADGRRPVPMPRMRLKTRGPGPAPMPNVVPAPSCREEPEPGPLPHGRGSVLLRIELRR